MLNKLSFILLLPLLLIGCSNHESHIQANALRSLLNATPVPLIIDVRSNAEYKSGHVPTAINIPFWQSFTTDILDNADKKTIILYCEHGPRAGVAKFAYYLAGFEKIVYLEGHMSAWRAAKHPME